jgi:chromosome segregation ATPase
MKQKLDEAHEKLGEQQQRRVEEDNHHDEEKSSQMAHLNKLSMQHVDAELNQAEAVAQSFFEENAKKNEEEPSLEETNYRFEHEQQKHRIEELEMEKKMMETKLGNIEASLARWIFRACDDKAELTKLQEKTAHFDKELETLKLENQQLRTDRDSCLNLFTINQVKIYLI